MRPEGSCRKVGVIYNEVALPSIKMDNMRPPWRYDRPCHREASRRLASFSQASLRRVVARLVAGGLMFNGGSARWTLSALSSTFVRRPCGELSRRPARIIYDCRATRNGTTLIEHCIMRIFLAGVSRVGKTTMGTTGYPP
jgi:hypothetical protein